MKKIFAALLLMASMLTAFAAAPANADGVNCSSYLLSGTDRISWYDDRQLQSVDFYAKVRYIRCVERDGDVHYHPRYAYVGYDRLAGGCGWTKEYRVNMGTVGVNNPGTQYFWCLEGRPSAEVEIPLDGSKVYMDGDRCFKIYTKIIRDDYPDGSFESPTYCLK